MPINLFSQDMNNIIFINDVADKEAATFGDAVKFFILTMGRKSRSYEKNIKYLHAKGIVESVNKETNTPLRRGTLSLMIAKYLNLRDSLLFMIFEIERYAFKACVANGIMDYLCSEWDIISGGELIEIMTNVSERQGVEH